MAIRMAIGDDLPETKTPLLNDVVQGSVDFNGLPSRRSRSGCWKSATFIIGVEVAERFAYFGISANLMSYLTGPLGQSTAAAAESINAWNGTASLLPFLGAFVADSYWGRYRTIIVASLLYILGLGLLSLSATLHSSNSSKCKIDANNSACSPSQLEVIFFFLSLYLVAFAQGGHKPCVQAFGANQFDEEDEDELKAKSSFFNWWYLSMSAGIIAALVVLSYIQENLSWELGFGIPCIVMCFALIVFLLGSTTYRFRIRNNQRNPFIRIGQVFVNAARNWRTIPTNISTNDTRFRFLDKAILKSENSEEDTNHCTINDIHDAKAILRLFPIWCTSLGYGVVFAQATTLFMKQGATMDRTIAYGIQIPSASLQSFIGVSIIIMIPIYDRVLVPTVRSMTTKPSGISMLQRIGIGIFLSIFVMIIAALVERQRQSIAIEHGLVDEPSEIVPMSVWWLAPQFLLLGMADVFAIVGLQEFFYDQVPDELKSIGLALYLSVLGIGSFLSSFLIYVIENMSGDNSWFSNNLNRAHLDYFYWVLTSLSTVTMVAYLYFARSYIY